MKKLLDPGYWARALRNPIVLAGLLVDLAPIYAVLVWGWGAAPLVLLYWTENVIAGLMTIPRLIISGANFGGLGMLAGVGLSAFFVFHYGLFCAVHGTFLFAFVAMSGDPAMMNSMPMMDIPEMVRASFQTGLHMVWMVYLVLGWQIVVFVWEFLVKSGWKQTNPMAEMFAPYQRIVVMHFAIFAGAGALFLLGEPMIGVLALILLRAVFGIMNNAALEKLDPVAKADVTTQAQFANLMKGKPADS